MNTFEEMFGLEASKNRSSLLMAAGEDIDHGAEEEKEAIDVGTKKV
jgi:hypothetical protein